MKLIVLTAVSAYETNIKELLQKSSIPQYSFHKVTGFRDSTLESVPNNWFASELNENESILFFAFVPESLVDPLFEQLNEFNASLEAKSKIHLFVSPIEKHSLS